MKKAFAVFGCICAGLLLIAVVLAAFLLPRALRLEHDGAAYLKGVLPEIVGTWDEKALASRATPELMASAKSPDEIGRMFRAFATLGKLKRIDEPKGSVFTGVFTGQGAVTVGNFTARAEFEGGGAIIFVQLRRVADGWKINGFHINSDAFLPK
jgi:hypothetical protein